MNMSQDTSVSLSVITTICSVAKVGRLSEQRLFKRYSSLTWVQIGNKFKIFSFCTRLYLQLLRSCNKEQTRQDLVHPTTCSRLSIIIFFSVMAKKVCAINRVSGFEYRNKKIIIFYLLIFMTLLYCLEITCNVLYFSIVSQKYNTFYYKIDF